MAPVISHESYELRLGGSSGLMWSPGKGVESAFWQQVLYKLPENIFSPISDILHQLFFFFRPTTTFLLLSYFFSRGHTHTHTHHNFLKCLCMFRVREREREKVLVGQRTIYWSSVCDRKTITGAFLAEPCSFSAVWRHSLQGFSWKFMSVTLSTLGRDDISLFAIYQ